MVRFNDTVENGVSSGTQSLAEINVVASKGCRITVSSLADVNEDERDIVDGGDCDSCVLYLKSCVEVVHLFCHTRLVLHYSVLRRIIQRVWSQLESVESNNHTYVRRGFRSLGSTT
jgi:hypothetical protein